MISAHINDTQFFKDMNNIMGYAQGFLEGTKSGEQLFLQSIARNGIEIFREFVDQQARIDPQMYHHIYEWYQVGSPEARLFDVEYVTYENGLTFNGNLRQSTSVSAGSTTPFYDKARIMEKGIPVVIKPKKSNVLRFNNGTEDVFVSGQIVVEHPGGNQVAGSFEHIFRIFFTEHFKQSVLEITGIRQYLMNPIDFKTNFGSAKTQGKAKGVQVGYNWITKAGDLNV